MQQPNINEFREELKQFLYGCYNEDLNPKVDAKDLYDTLCEYAKEGLVVEATEQLIKLEEWFRIEKREMKKLEAKYGKGIYKQA